MKTKARRRCGRAYSCWRGESVTRGDRRRRELGFGDRRRRSPASPNRRREWALWVGVRKGRLVIYCHWPKQWNCWSATLQAIRPYRESKTGWTQNLATGADEPELFTN